MTAQTIVTLSNGCTLPAPALLLLWSLESRGVKLTLEGTNIAAGPSTRLTDLDREELRRWRYALAQVIARESADTVQ